MRSRLGRRRGAAQLRLQRGHGLQHPRRGSHHGAPRRGGLQPARRAVEQTHAQPVLGAQQRAADRRLREVQASAAAAVVRAVASARTCI